MSIEKRLIALLSLRASEFNNIFTHFHSVMHKSDTKYLQSCVAFKRDEIRGTHSVLSEHEIYMFHIKGGEMRVSSIVRKVKVNFFNSFGIIQISGIYKLSIYIYVALLKTFTE